MYSFLLKSNVNAAVLPEQAYDFFTYDGKQPVTVDFRGKSIEIKKGTRFGVRPSTNGKHVRLIFPSDPTRVITLDLAMANKLADGVKSEAAQSAAKAKTTKPGQDKWLRMQQNR